jgi:DNA polymerase-3 subunit alpha
MKTLFFDFETTGKILRRELLNDPAQPRAVSVGLLLVADGYGVIGQSKFLIKPDGFVIPDDVVKVHGITTQMATEYGVPCAVAMQVLNHFAHKADECVAFNADFDYKIIQIESMKLGKPYHMPMEKVRCCMLPYKDILKIPGLYGDFKWPSLDEVCNFLGITREGGHDALGDVYMTMRVWYELKRRGVVP